MPQPPIDEYWKKAIISVLEQHRGLRWSDRKTRQVLMLEAERLKNDPDPVNRLLAQKVPSERSIGRVRKEVWPNLPPEERALYQTFFWPESMGQSGLPWEAGPAGLELLAFLDSNGLFQMRPTVRLVRWFWRVSQICPDEDVFSRAFIAGNLAYNDLFGRVGAYRPWEWQLAYTRVWGETKKDREELYGDALFRGTNPLPQPKMDLINRCKMPDDLEYEESFSEMFLLFALEKERTKRKFIRRRYTK